LYKFFTGIKEEKCMTMRRWGRYGNGANWEEGNDEKAIICIYQGIL